MPSHYSPNDREWLSQKDTIRDLYINQNKTLNDLIYEMENKYGFIASKYKYTSMLESWGLRKNLKREHYQTIDPSEDNPLEESDETYEFQGRQVSFKRLKRGLARYNRQGTSNHSMLDQTDSVIKASLSDRVAKAFVPNSQRPTHRRSRLPCLECHRLIFSFKYGARNANQMVFSSSQQRRRTAKGTRLESSDSNQATLVQGSSLRTRDKRIAGSPPDSEEDLNATIYACLVPPMFEKDRRRQRSTTVQLVDWLKSMFPTTADFSPTTLAAQLISDDSISKSMTFVFLTIYLWQNRLLSFGRFDIFMEWAVANEVAMSILYTLVFSSWSSARELMRYLLHSAIRIQNVEVVRDLVSSGTELIDQSRIYDPEHGLTWTPLKTALAYGNDLVAKMCLSTTTDLETITDQELCHLIVLALEHRDKAQLIRPLIEERNSHQPLGVIVEAVKGGARIDALEDLLASGADVNAALLDENGIRTAILSAIELQQTETLEFLLKQGASPDGARRKLDAEHGLRCSAECCITVQGHESTPLIEAVKHQMQTAVELLLRHGADVNLKCGQRTALEEAVSCMSLDMVRLLCRGEPDDRIIDQVPALKYAIAKKYVSIVEELLRSGILEVTGRDSRLLATLFVEAIESGCVGTARLLYNAGADPDLIHIGDHYSTVLQYAAYLSDADMMQFLIDAGADVHANPAPNSSTTVLKAAILGRRHSLRRKCVEVALANGALSEQYEDACKDIPLSTMQVAVREGDMYIVTLLSNMGCQIEAIHESQWKRLELELAVKSGMEQKVFELLRGGLNPNRHIFPRSDTSLLDDAILMQNARIVEALLMWKVHVTSSSPRHAICAPKLSIITMILKNDISQLSPADIPWDEIVKSGLGITIYQLLQASNIWQTGGPCTLDFDWVFDASDTQDVWVDLILELNSERIFGQDAHARLFRLALKYGFLEVAKTIVFRRPDYDRWLNMTSALRLAAKRNDHETLSWLLSLGPNPHLSSHGWVVLLDAAEMGSLSNMSRLFDHGVQIESPDILQQLVDILWRWGKVDALVMILENTDVKMISRMIDSVRRRSETEEHLHQLAGFLDALSLAEKSGSAETRAVIVDKSTAVDSHERFVYAC